MKADQIVKGKDFSTGKGLPEGKTVIELATAEFDEKDFPDEAGNSKTTYSVTIPTEKGKETYRLPLSVMSKVKDAVEKKAAALEVNRQGTTQKDTKYVTYLLDTNGKIMK